jgi:hypothetical protein
MIKEIFMIGQSYSNWTVIKEDAPKRGVPHFLCKCNCGNERVISKHKIIAMTSKTCQKCMHAHKHIINPGDRFGKWTVVRQIPAEEKRKHYEVKCDCGSIKVLKGIRLRFGDSIGCRKCGSTKHSMVHSKTYHTWESMIQRCTNPSNSNYKHYGARGITVDTKWLTFAGFFEDMGERPKGLELDRIDNDGGYSKENCRWVTHQVNLNNRERK